MRTTTANPELYGLLKTLIEATRFLDDLKQLDDVPGRRANLTAALNALTREEVFGLAADLNVLLTKRTKKDAVRRLVRWATERSHIIESIAY